MFKGLVGFSGVAAEVLQEARSFGWKGRQVGRALVVLDDATDETGNLQTLRTPVFVLEDVSWGGGVSESLCNSFADSPISDALMVQLCGADLQRLVARNESFAVRVVRGGDVRINSEAVARGIGSLIRLGAETKGRIRPPVNLRDPDVEIIAGFHADEWYVGRFVGRYVGRARPTIDTSHEPNVRHPASLHAALAASLVRMSEVFLSGGSLLDPFCGSGSILAEAQLVSRPNLRPRSCDVHMSPSMIRGFDTSDQAIQTALPRLRSETCQVDVGNARNMSLLGPGEIDVVITNPPWGVRLGSSRGVDRTYRRFAHELCRLRVKEVVCLTSRKNSWMEIMGEAGWTMISLRSIDYGKMPVWAFIHRNGLDFS
jgi:tRNA (guanine6-N2)-methyltransferase